MNIVSKLLLVTLLAIFSCPTVNTYQDLKVILDKTSVHTNASPQSEPGGL